MSFPQTVWIGSEQRSDAEWYAVKAFLSEFNAKTWMYEASNRSVEELEIAEVPIGDPNDYGGFARMPSPPARPFLKPKKREGC